MMSFSTPLIRRIVRGQASVSRFFSSTLTPEEAGRKAEAMAKKQRALPERLATRLAHAGMTVQANAPMAPPLHLATTYTRPSDGQYLETDSIYSRGDNPTRLLLEKTMAELECDGAEGETTSHAKSFAFSSGMMAASSIILAHRAPVTVLLPPDCYHGVGTVLADVFTRFQVNVTQVNMANVSEVKEAIERSDPSSQVIVWMETPSNPLCQITDIRAVCDAVRSVDRKEPITTMVDGTLSPPCITQPLSLGADLVMHSGTKYLAGHSDALLGIVTTSPTSLRGQELAPLIHSVQTEVGGVASPFDSWLALRGMRTLHVRVERQCHSAMVVAEYLNQHPSVTAVHYPGLASHPLHSVAARQMKNGWFGCILSLELESEVMAMAVAGALRTIQRATSLGGTETLIEHRASIEPPPRRTSPPGLLRMSVGLEDPADLLADLENALAIAKKVVS